VVILLPRSDLLRRVLGCLRDHPHDDTVGRIARLLAIPAEDVEVALRALAEDGLVGETRSHWVLSRNGWASARADDPFDGLE
jgi:DNA-binding IclR family transcriptional regulator